MRRMARKLHDWIVVGISGVTCGGKTSLANKLAKSLAGARVLHQDTYFYPDDSPHHVRCPGIAHNNYDILSALDMKRMAADAVAITAGPCAEAGAEVVEGAGATEGAEAEEGRPVLMLEGFSVLNYRPIYEMCTKRYYFVLEYGECLSRRVLRHYEPPDIDGYFEQCVWPEHIKYRAELENDSGVTFLDGTRPDVYDEVLCDLKRLGAKEVSE